MIKEIFRRIKNGIHPVKQYTIEEWSKKQIEDLRCKGAIIGDSVDIIDASIDMISPYLIQIGNNVTITNCRILTHDGSTKKFLGYTKVGKVEIGDNVFIGADAIILPDTKIGSNVIIGSGTVVAKDIPDNSVVAGNPCMVICSFDEYIARQRKNMETLPVIENVGMDLNQDGFKNERERLILTKKGFVL